MVGAVLLRTGYLLIHSILGNGSLVFLMQRGLQGGGGLLGGCGPAGEGVRVGRAAFFYQHLFGRHVRV